MAASTISFVVTKTPGVQGSTPDLYTITSTTNAPNGTVEQLFLSNPTSQNSFEPAKASWWNEFTRQAALAT